jgi:amino acid permease
MDHETALPLSREQPAELSDMEPCVTTEEVAIDPDRPRVGLISTLLILVNVVVGPSLLGMPATFGYCGIIPGELFVIGVVLLSYVATALTLTLQRATNSGSLDDTAECILGWKGRVPLSIMILVFNVCGMFCCLVVATDIILSWPSHRLDPSSLWPRSAIVFAYGLCAPIALSIPRNLAVLGYVSGPDIFCAFFFAGVMAIELWQHGAAPGVNVWTAGARSVESIGLYAVIFSMTLCVCPLLTGSHRDVAFRRRAAGISMLMATLLITVPSLCAYLVYGSRCEEKILDNLTNSKSRHLASQIMIFAIASCSYPLMHRPVCCSLASMVF